jgi:hypothetical protein
MLSPAFPYFSWAQFVFEVTGQLLHQMAFNLISLMFPHNQIQVVQFGRQTIGMMLKPFQGIVSEDTNISEPTIIIIIIITETGSHSLVQAGLELKVLRLSLPNAGVTGTCHHALLSVGIINFD